MNQQIELWPLSIDALYEGMYIDFDVYYLHENSFMLLCNKVELTYEDIENFKNIVGVNRNIYVQKANQQMILNKSAYFLQIQKRIEDTIGYTEIKQETHTMLRQVAQQGTLDRILVDDISSELMETLNTVEDAIIIQCLNTVREVDEYLYNHSANVAMLNGLIAKWLGLQKEQIDKLVRIGLIHDIGKLKVPQNLLNKPETLTPEEFDEIKPHSRYSFELLKTSGECDMEILNAALQHHEKINGTGYPLGLRGKNIAYFARITAVSDVYDAMISKRVYKEPHSPFETLYAFSLGRFSDLDIEIVNVFLRNMPLELTGKLVLLSDGSVARVLFANPENIRYPIVSVDGKTLPTNETLYCVSMLQEAHTLLQ